MKTLIPELEDADTQTLDLAAALRQNIKQNKFKQRKRRALFRRRPVRHDKRKG